MSGTIFDIQRFCINDGPGIRTVVFFKGCPLNCIWCHNPESRKKECELMFYKDRCVGCGRCKKNPEDASICRSGARVICGREVCAEEVIEQAVKDRVFYKNSGGGVTLSGGEPFFQPEFMTELLKEIKKHDIHTAVETCGAVSGEAVVNAADYIDLFLFDYKETNPEKHRQFTGADNGIILENLALLGKLNKKVILRCPIIKGINDRAEHFDGIASTANKYDNILHIEVEPYHALGEAKRLALGKLPNNIAVATEKEKAEYIDAIQSGTNKKTILA